jgi:signal transduction histidine kinase
LVVTVPLIGLALSYLVQTQILLANLTQEVQTQAIFLVEMTSQQISIWRSTDDAQAFVARISPMISSQIMLVDASGKLLAASSADTQKDPSAIEGMQDALGGQTQLQVDRSLAGTQNEDVIQMLVPVVDKNQQLLGVIRLNFPLARLQERIQNSRNLTIWVLVGGLILGLALGWGFAMTIERPLYRTTAAITALTQGDEPTPIPEGGPLELRLLVRAFNSLSSRLKTLEESRKRLLANLVHELGRPLGALHSATEALQGGAAQDENLRAELLSGIDGEIDRLRNLLEDLAHLHDQEIGALELDLKPTPMSDWLRGLLSPWREAAAARKLEFITDIPDDLPTISIDPDRLGQALGNLISNAINYTPALGRVVITTHSEDGYFLIQVKDTGPGISPEEQNRILSPYYRGASSRRASRGMGLGLTIANELILAHNGEMLVESALGKGSTFSIQLHLP